MLIDVEDLREAFDFQEQALRIYDDQSIEQAYRDNVLVIAGLRSCGVLKSMDEDFWSSLVNGQLSSRETATEILTDYIHAKKRVLPASERLLLLLGFKPPSAAKKLVEAACKAFEAAHAADPQGMHDRISLAKEHVAQLRDEICRLSQELSDSLKAGLPVSQEKRSLLRRLVLKSRKIAASALLPLVIFGIRTEVDQIIEVPPGVVQEIRHEVERLSNAGLDAIHLLGLHEAARQAATEGP